VLVNQIIKVLDEILSRKFNVFDNMIFEVISKIIFRANRDFQIGDSIKIQISEKLQTPFPVNLWIHLNYSFNGYVDSFYQDITKKALVR
jgi:hypothetical protein